MKIACTKCGTECEVPASPPRLYRCPQCGALLPTAQVAASTSEAVGLIGGAALGAAVAGPTGAVVGAVLGAILGRNSKGIG